MGCQPVTAILLDPHVLIWLLQGSDRLGQRSLAQIRAAAETDTLLLAAISPWEIAMLVAKGRLALDRDVGDWVAAALVLPGIALAPLLPEIAVASIRLPGILHADPADRLIVATARHHNAALITDDDLLLDYGKAGHVKTFRASR